jgi:hypothetical protein
VEEPTSAEMAALEKAWRAAQAQWLIEKRQPLLSRQHFQVGEIAQALARKSGRREIDERERRRIVVDLLEWIEREEFEESDVLMLAGQPQLFAPFLPEFRTLREEAEREGRNLWADADYGADCPVLELTRSGVVHVNIEAIVLRKPGVRRYLETCELGGARRVASRSWWKMPMAVISSGLVTGSSGQIE